MEQGKPFLGQISGAENTQSIITALQNIVKAINALNSQVTSSLTNIANPTGA